MLLRFLTDPFDQEHLSPLTRPQCAHAISIYSRKTWGRSCRWRPTLERKSRPLWDAENSCKVQRTWAPCSPGAWLLLNKNNTHIKLVIFVHVHRVTCTVHMDVLDPEAFDKCSRCRIKCPGPSLADSRRTDVRRVPEPAELVSPPDSDKPTSTPPLHYRR